MWCGGDVGGGSHENSSLSVALRLYCRAPPKKELQQRVVFQQHNSLIGGPSATSCPVCHKLCLGGEALMEHMKITHKDPNASGVASKYANLTSGPLGRYVHYDHFFKVLYIIFHALAVQDRTKFQ